MLQRQKVFWDYLQGIEKKLASFSDGDNKIYEPEKLSGLREKIAEQELIVPVVGGFSAGKSTLINALLSKPYLPVAITPETSLAAELRYTESSSGERLELVDRNDRVENLTKEQFNIVKEKAVHSKLVRVYLHEKVLQDIEPLVLVDMPGFESPLDLHNEAIFAYIEKGVSYVVLTSIEDGNISRSMVRQLLDIRSADESGSFQRDFSFYLSKANLRPPGDVKDVKSYIEDQIEEQLDVKTSIVPIGEDGGKELKDGLDSLDPNKLFTNIFQPTLLGIFHDIIDNINMILSALREDRKTNEERLKELAASKAKVEKKQEEAIAEAESRYSISSVDSIVNYVGSQLSSAFDELVSAAKQGGETLLSQRISEISRSALITKTGEVLENITNNLAGDFSLELNSLNQQLGDSLIDKAGGMALTYAQHIKGKVLEFMKTPPVVRTGLGALSKGTALGFNASSAALSTRVLGGTIAVALPGIGTVIGVLITFLPEIVGLVTAKVKESKQDEIIRQQIITSIIPDVKRKVSRELQVHFTQQVKTVIEQVSDQFSQQIEQHEESIRKAQEEYEQNKGQIEKRVSEYETLKAEIEQMSKPVLFS